MAPGTGNGRGERGVCQFAVSRVDRFSRRGGYAGAADSISPAVAASQRRPKLDLLNESLEWGNDRAFRISVGSGSFDFVALAFAPERRDVDS